MKTLLLWDIDGTLVNTAGAGFVALQTALRETFDCDRPLDGIEFAGRTDLWIIRQIYAKFGIQADADATQQLLARYLSRLPGELAASPGYVLPGIAPLLQAARDRGEVAQGLLTGNVRHGAACKLAHYGLWDYFQFGAYGDDSEDRNALGPYARHRAEEHHGVSFASDRIWVIGDTPHDIACGKACGAQTLAVATGRYSVQQLQNEQPDAVFADLSDPAAFWRLVGA